MADRSFTVDIVTPERVLVHDEATHLAAPGTEGSFGILTHHAPMLAELATGELRYRKTTGEEERLAVSGGFLQVFENRVTVLADTAERSAEIDLDRARRARDAAGVLLAGPEAAAAGTAAHADAQAALKRAQNRLFVAGD